MEFGLEELAVCLTNRRLQLILLSTEACNFRCTYCYETFQQKRMRPEVVAGVKRLLSRRAPGLEHLSISWFGGEPLLAFDVIEEVMGHADRLRRSNPAMAVASDITTNAWLLTRSRAERLLDLAVGQFQISFDGPRESHDRKRVRPGGLGTFDVVWGRLIDLRGLGRPFAVTVRLHVARDNADAMPEFLREFAKEFGGDARFQLFIRTLGRFGGPNDAALPVLEDDEARKVVGQLRERATALGIRLTPAPKAVNVCYAARPNSLLIRADGSLNKCTLALEHPKNRVGRLLGDGTVQLERARMLPWLRGLESGNAAELLCPMRGLADPAPSRAAGRTGAIPLLPGGTGIGNPIGVAGGVR